ncbi:hypothetical protein QOZ51_30210, partial [Pseudomonas aeruginosa]|uniref:hypothetical protein n=1 Tax=Pseudomonas aeruginosa TaxID=287 RepID=UPI003459F802
MSDTFGKKKAFNPLEVDAHKDSTDAPKGVVAEITSSRTFGVELEVFGGDIDEMRQFAVENNHNYTHDGSIKNTKGNNEGCEE